MHVTSANPQQRAEEKKITETRRKRDRVPIFLMSRTYPIFL